MAVGYQQEGNRGEARKAWQAALDTSSERYETIALLGLGSVADQDGEVALALSYWRRATAKVVTKAEETWWP
jgi:hypothetical protein